LGIVLVDAGGGAAATGGGAAATGGGATGSGAIGGGGDGADTIGCSKIADVNVAGAAGTDAAPGADASAGAGASTGGATGSGVRAGAGAGSGVGGTSADSLGAGMDGAAPECWTKITVEHFLQRTRAPCGGTNPSAMV
jgi:hypothetical protein